MQAKMELGATFDTLTRGELSDELALQTQEQFRQLARGLKYMRFGPYGTNVVTSAFALDGSTLGIGPREGYAWSIRRVTVWGLTSGATPDVALLYRTTGKSFPVWEFTGNAAFASFGKLELLLLPGEHLDLISSGTIAATGSIVITGDLIQVPAEEVWKLV